MTYKQLLYTSILAGAVTFSAACAIDNQDIDGERTGTSTLALTSDTLGDTDIRNMQFTIDRVSCVDGTSLAWSDSRIVDYEDMYLPGGISHFEDAPYDSESQHIFSDAYFLVDAGCYDVLTEPLTDDNLPSQDCQPATKKRVAVEDGQTTEVLLINQCKGAERGGLDVIGSINHPPEIDDLVFETSKFIAACQDANNVCVTASDPDNDPIAFDWRATNAGLMKGSILPISQTQNQDGSWTSCAKVATGPKGDYGFRVRAFDLDGNGKRIERSLKQQDDQASTRSRDVLNFPMYAGVDCQGRSAVLLMAMQDISDATAAVQFIQQTAAWAAPLSNSADNSVLYVLDDNHSGEHPGDDAFVQAALNGVFTTVQAIPEPAAGVTLAALQNHDLVWFANPGYPMDDPASYDALQGYLAQGGGLIIQGDDMAGPAVGPGSARDMSYFSHLDYIDNGTQTCGDQTDQPGVFYDVTFSNEPLSALNGLRGGSFTYQNDIDHTKRTLSGERVLAEARYDNGTADCPFTTPAAVAIDPVDL